MMPPGADFLDITFDRLDLDEATRWLSLRSASDRFTYVVTPNVDHVVKLEASASGAEIRLAYSAAALRLCDSRIVAKLARLCAIDLPVVPGSDLTVRLFERVLVEGDRLCLIGGDPAMLARLRERWPALDIRHHMPPMGMLAKPEAMAAAVDFIVQARARFTLLAVAFPQQEILALRASRSVEAVGTGLCIGASLDFLTGRKSRAPIWMRRASLEWLYRLLAEPRRLWRRYLVEGPRIFLLTLRWRKRG